jgi:hypothetical protein
MEGIDYESENPGRRRHLAALYLERDGANEARRAGGPLGIQADIARFCSQVPPGHGRIKACMKEHLPELSEPCKEGLFQAWLKQ